MIYNETIKLKNNATCLLRNEEKSDAKAFLDYYIKCHEETDFLLTYPDETKRSLEDMEKKFNEIVENDSNIEIVATIQGKIVGSAGINKIKDCYKIKHRAEFGVSVLKEYWGLGIGTALTKACIECAKKMNFIQLELDVVSDNINAIELYSKFGFVEYGRNPKGFRSRSGKWQELVLMRLEL